MKKESVGGRKKAMNLIMLLCYAYMDGIEKLLHMVVEKNKPPFCFLKDHSELPMS